MQLYFRLPVFPPFQTFHAARKKPCYQFRLSAFDHFRAAKFLKLRYRTVKCECSVLVAIAAIRFVPAAIGVCSAALRVFAHWHPATLTKFVFCVHCCDFYRL
jgi:hypothetical protein